MNLELFHKEFHSIILQLIYNNLLRLSVDGITKQPSTYV